MQFGADAGWAFTDAQGLVPERGGDFGGVSGTTAYDVAHRDARGGAYGEVTRAFGRVTPTVGLRSDYFSVAHAARVDPRVSVAIDLGAAGRLRTAWGIYHQAPSPSYFDDVRGANHAQADDGGPLHRRLRERPHRRRGVLSRRGVLTRRTAICRSRTTRPATSTPATATRAGSISLAAASGTTSTCARARASLARSVAGRHRSSAIDSRCRRARGRQTSRFRTRGRSS